MAYLGVGDQLPVADGLAACVAAFPLKGRHRQVALNTSVVVQVATVKPQHTQPLWDLASRCSKRWNGVTPPVSSVQVCQCLAQHAMLTARRVRSSQPRVAWSDGVKLGLRERG